MNSRLLQLRNVLGPFMLLVGFVGLILAPWIPFKTSIERFVPPEERRESSDDLFLLVSVSRPREAVSRTDPATKLFRVLKEHPAVQDGLDPRIMAARSRAPMEALWSDLALPGQSGLSVGELPLVADRGRVLNGLYRISPQYREGQRLLDGLMRIQSRYVPDSWAMHAAGIPVINGWMAREARHMQKQLVPILVGVLMLVLILLYRSWRVFAAVVPCVGAAAGWIFVVMYGLGVPHDLLSVLPPLLVMVITVSGTVHILSEIESGPDSYEDRLAVALRRKGPPALFCHLSTAAGFGSLALSRMPSVRALGLVSGIGLLTMSLVLFTAFPLLLSRLQPQRSRIRIPEPRILTRLASSRRVSGGIVLVSLLVLAGGVVLYPSLDYESRALMYFPEDHPLRKDVDVISRDFLPPRHDTLRITWNHSPAPWEVERWRLDAVKRKGIHTILRPEWFGTGVFARPRTVNSSEERVIVFYDVDTVDRLQSHRKALRQLAGSAFQKTPTITFEGVLDRITGVQNELKRTLQVSMAAAAGVIFFMLFVTIRDRYLFCAGVVANLVPLAGVILVMWLSAISLDAGMILIFSVTLGLALDDTIHFLYLYDSGELSASATLQRSISPLTVTTLVLCSGIGVLSLASFRPVAHFGMFATLGLVGALAADLVFLPAALSGGRQAGSR